MIFLVELLLIIILLTITVTLILDEKRHRARVRHLVRIKSYWNGENRRRVMRHATTLIVDYSRNHNFRPSTSRDISTHGVGLILDEKLGKKTLLSLEIKINDRTEPIKAKARVMWSQEVEGDERDKSKHLFHTGIKFVRFSNPAQEKKLFDYIRSIEKDITEDYVQT